MYYMSSYLRSSKQYHCISLKWNMCSFQFYLKMAEGIHLEMGIYTAFLLCYESVFYSYNYYSVLFG